MLAADTARHTNSAEVAIELPGIYDGFAKPDEHSRVTIVRAAPEVPLAAGETAILLHPPLPLVGVSIGMEGGLVVSQMIELSPTATR